MGPGLHSSYCRYRNRLCLYSHKGDFCPVWDSLSPTYASFAVKIYSAFCSARNASDCLCGAVSVAKQAGRPGEINADSVLKIGTLFLQLSLERNALSPEEILWWRSVLQHLGVQVCLLQSCIHEMYFLGLLHVTQHRQPSWAIRYAELSLTLLISNLIVFSPWKGQMSPSKASPEKHWITQSNWSNNLLSLYLQQATF